MAFVRPLEKFRTIVSNHTNNRSVWLAQLGGHATLDLRVVGLSPALDVEFT